MQKVLITGGLGYIGSHTCVTLLNKNFELVVIDNLSNSSENTLQKIKKIVGKEKGKSIVFHKGDINDIKFLEDIFSKSSNGKNDIKSVIHFAGLKSVSESVNSPIRYWETNVSGSINLLKIMKKYNCKTLVFSSSATIYGNYGLRSIPEDAIIKPINPYGQTKSTVEKILENLFLSGDQEWRIANLRYFNPVGAHPSGLIGEQPKGKPNNLLPIIIKVATKEQNFLKIFGNDWPTNDGTCIRDYIHVMDLAEGHLAALLNLIKGESKIINLNLGTGIGTSVLEMIDIFETVNKCKLPCKVVRRRDGDVASLVADSKKAKKYLKWIPKRTLKDSCLDSFKWIKLNKML